MQENFVETAYGRIHYVEAGSGTGTPLLLTHSGGASLHEFDGNLDYLSQYTRVIAWDLPGHGDSGLTTTHLSVEDYAKATVSLMDALNVDKFHFAGASIGGLTAAELGANHADRLAKLIIIDTQLRTQQWWIDNWDMVEGMFTEVVQPIERVAPRFKALTDDVYRRWNMDRSKCGTRMMMDVVWAAREFDVIGQLPKVDVPTLILVGGAGPVTECIDDFQRLSPNSRLEVLDGCGHFPMIDEPQIFNSLLTDFLGLEK